MRASIIIPAYNAERTLGACLAACLAQEGDGFEVILVDDGSTDGTRAIAERFPAVRVIAKANAGPAAARNAGAREAAGQFVVYTDSDCVPEPNWLERLLAPFEEDVAAVGGTYRCANPESRLARVVQAEIEARHRRFQGDVDFLGSFNVAYRKAAFDAAGGFDEQYRQASGEDNDLAYRLQDAGGRLFFTREAAVAHYHPERLNAYLRTQARHGYWRMKLYRDHPGRAGGDQYAGLSDLLAPPLGLLVVLFPALLLGVGVLGWPVARLLPAFASLVTVYVLLHIPKIWRLRDALSGADLLYFGWMCCLRDIARSFGLLRGLWRFRILGRRS